MAARATVLKALLRERHLQGHQSFCKEYDKVAVKLDPDLRGSWPSKAQFYRWLSGELAGMPYPHHCRILESMFHGWKAEQLFQPHDSAIGFVPEPARKPELAPEPPASPNGTAAPENLAGITSAFASRTEFAESMPPNRLFDGARTIQVAGLSLNILCQHYSDKSLAKLLESDAIIQCLFLDPDGQRIKDREQEENLPDGHLTALTRLNMEALARLRSRLPEDVRDNMSVRTYDETIRFNITIVDDAKCVVQPYLPDARGLESPTFVAEHQPDVPGLFDTFQQAFRSMWERAKEVPQ